MKRGMNRKKRLDVLSKQETRERYETARRESGEAKSGQDNVSGTTEGVKKTKDHTDEKPSNLRNKIPRLSRTIEENTKTGSLSVSIDKGTRAKSLVDPSYGDRSGVETFDYSHRQGDNVPFEGDSDDLRSFIDKQRKTSHSGVDLSKGSKKGSIVYDSKIEDKEHSDKKDSKKKKDSKMSASSLGRNDKNKGSRRSEESSRKKQGNTSGPSGYELGKPFFSGGGKSDKKKSKPEEMDIEETLKELAYLRSIQTGENALPKEEEEYFLKMNDLSKASSSMNLNSLLTGGNTATKKYEQSRGGSTDLNQSASKWDKVIDVLSGKISSKKDSKDDGTYGPSLPPKAPAPKLSTATSKNTNSSKTSTKEFPVVVRGARGGRGRGIRGRGRGRGRGFDESLMRGRGRARGIRGGQSSVPLRGRHIFKAALSSGSRRRSRSTSRSSRSSSSSRSRSRRNSSHSRSHERSSIKRRRRNSSRSSYSSSSSSRSKSHSKDKDKDKKPRTTSGRNRSRSSSGSSRSHSKTRSERPKRGSKERRRSRSRSRKRKDRSRSWSFDEVYTETKGEKHSNKSKVKPYDKGTSHSKPPAKNRKSEPKTEHKQAKGKDPEKPSKEKAKPDPSLSPAVAAMAIKELKVAAGSGVFLPRTVTKTISQGMQLTKGRGLFMKTHPAFAARNEVEEEAQKSQSPKETEEDRERRHEFSKEIDKVFNAKPWPEEKKVKGKWTPVLSVEEQKEREKALVTKRDEIDLQDNVDVQMEIEPDKKDIFDNMSKDNDKKERKEKKRKDKEEKNKRKKDKKEKKEKKKKEKELEASETGNATNIQGAFNNQDMQGGACSEYNQHYQEYPEDAYGEGEQGWYDENGEFHPTAEGECYYYYDIEGNIVGYEGPEGYVEGNPFEGQEYPLESQGEGWQENQEYPSGYEEGEGQNENGDQSQEIYYAEEQYQVQGDADQWEGYQGEPQWYGAEGAYPGTAEPMIEDLYQEGHIFQEQANTIDPNQIKQNYGNQLMADQDPVAAQEHPSALGGLSLNAQSLITELAAKANPSLMLEMAARGIGETELLSFISAQLTQFAKAQGLPFKEPDKSEGEPVQLAMDLGPPKPVISKEHSAQREDSQQKPLKSILKKGNPVSLKPPTKGNTPKDIPGDPGSTPSASLLLGQECIISLSEHGMERFFCKLCKCHIESSTAKDLHVKSMKHIELFVLEKSPLLQSVIGNVPADKESIASERDGEGMGKVGHETDLKHERSWEDTEKLGPHDLREHTEIACRHGKSSDDDKDLIGVMDYDRLRLRGRNLRDLSGNLDRGLESELITKDYGHGKSKRHEPARDYHDYDYRYDQRRERDDFGRTPHDDMPKDRYSDRQGRDDYSEYERRRPYPPEDRQRYSERVSRDYENEQLARRHSPDRESDSSRRSALSFAMEDSEHEYREFFEYSGQYPPYDEERELSRQSHSREYQISQRDLQGPEDRRERNLQYGNFSNEDQPESRPDKQQTQHRDTSLDSSAQPQPLMELGKPQGTANQTKQPESSQNSTSNQDRSNGTSSEPLKLEQNERQEVNNLQQRPELSGKVNNKSGTANQYQNMASSRSQRPSSADRNKQRQPNQDQKKSRSAEQSLSTQGMGKKQEKNKVLDSETNKVSSRDKSKLTTANKTNTNHQMSSEQRLSQTPKVQSKSEPKPNIIQKSKEEIQKMTAKKPPPSNMASTLGDPPGNLITTVAAGLTHKKAKRVPPPPPRYSKDNGQKSVRGSEYLSQGRGGHPKPVGRGYSQNPSNQSGEEVSDSSMSTSLGGVSQSRGLNQMGVLSQSSVRPISELIGFSQPIRSPLHVGSQPLPNSGSLQTSPPSIGPAQVQAFSFPQDAFSQSATGSYYGTSSRGQPTSFHRLGGSHMRGSPQFSGRARGGRDFHPQRW